MKSFSKPISLALLGVFLVTCLSCSGPAQESAGDGPDSDSPVDLPASSLSSARGDLGEPELGGASWPRLLNKEYDGVADSVGFSPDWTRPLEVAWSLPVGSGYGLGSVDGDHYYHVDAVSDNFQWSERLTAYRISDGQQVWTVQRPLEYRDLYGYETGPRGTPTTDGKVIITFGCDGGLVCREVDGGKLRWSVDTNKAYFVVQNFFGVGSSPLILGSKVIVSVGGSPPEDQEIAPGRLERVSPNGSALVAFDLATGKELWRCGDDLASYSSPRVMTVDGKQVVLLFARDHLLAVDPDKGVVRWKHFHRSDIVESVNAMVPVVDNDRIFISECYQVGSVHLKVGEGVPEVIWQDPPRDRRRQAMRCHWSTPVLIDGYLYGCSGRNNPDSDFRCVEMATGKVMWVEDLRIRTSVARVGDVLVVLNERGEMKIVRPNSEKLDVIAEQDFSDQVSSPCWAAPIIVGNRMFIRGGETVLCLAIAE